MIKNRKNIINETEEITEDMENSDIKNNPEQSASADVNNEKTGEAENNIQKEESSDKQNVEGELEKKIKEIEILTDTMKRRQADFENYKKRMIKSQEEQKKLAIKDMALDIININDDLLRAREAACNVNEGQTVTEVCDSFADGFSMISKSIEEMLQKYGIEEIDSLNKAFDPNFNEAVEIDESNEVEDDTITRVYLKGFRLDDYLVRAAKVKVTKPVKKPDEKNDSSKTDNEEVQ